MSKKFEFTVLKVFKTQRLDKKNRVDLRVVVWPRSKPMLEKRKIWETEEEERMGKAKGFDADDFQFILEHRDEIQPLLEGEQKDG